MTNLAVTNELFFDRTGMDPRRIDTIVGEALAGMDDGELFLEYSQSESVSLDDGRIKSASFDTTQGFGLRAVAGEAAGYAHASELSEAAIRRAATAVRAVASGHHGTIAEPPPGTNRSLYTDLNPLGIVDLAAKTRLLTEIDAYARGRDPRVRQVMASLSGVWQAVQIIRPDGRRAADIRPLVRLNVAIVVGEGDRMETGSHGAGGRVAYDVYLDPANWQAQAEEALRQALVNLGSVPAPAGTMTVVLGSGWPGVMLHEAVGHGLEGDFNRKKTSAFSGLIGQQVAATGNGRRQSFAHAPIPRMTNTYMLAGAHDPQEIIGSVKRGVYAVNFGGGSVDITSGKFVFSASEAYLIEDGKVGPAVKGATLIGNGPDAVTKITMIGNDLRLDDGVGTCGKDGQGVPVGVGQPTLRMDGLTVGGTAA